MEDITQEQKNDLIRNGAISPSNDHIFSENNSVLWSATSIIITEKLNEDQLRKLKYYTSNEIISVMNSSGIVEMILNKLKFYQCLDRPWNHLFEGQEYWKDNWITVKNLHKKYIELNNPDCILRDFKTMMSDYYELKAVKKPSGTRVCMKL